MPSSRTLLECNFRQEKLATKAPRKITPVKNTFVHFETSDEDLDKQEPCCPGRHVVRRRTKRSATAPLLLQPLLEEEQLSEEQLSVSDDTTPGMPTASESLVSLTSFTSDNDSSDESSPSLPLVHHVLSGLSDADTFASTPTGSECDFSASKSKMASAATDAGNEKQLRCPKEELRHPNELLQQQFSEQSAAELPAGSPMLVQIPITLPAGFTADALGDSVKATVESLSQNCLAAGEVVFDVRLRLSLQMKTKSTPKPVALAAALAPPPPPPAAPPSLPPAPAPTATAVCCHWKNKGFCTYMDTCKFLHPEHRRGVGSAKAAAPTRSRGGIRRGGRLSREITA
jgi:hypothetical protein